MHNSTRSGSIGDSPSDRREPTAREADRAGKAGDSVAIQSFTIRPKTAVIEIRDGRVAVKVTKSEVA
jgi:hypothetical protein